MAMGEQALVNTEPASATAIAAGSPVGSLDSLGGPMAPARTREARETALNWPAGAAFRISMRLALAVGLKGAQRVMAEELAHELDRPSREFVALFNAMAADHMGALDSAIARFDLADESDAAALRHVLTLAPTFAKSAASRELAKRVCRATESFELVCLFGRLMQMECDWRLGVHPEGAPACEALMEAIADQLASDSQPLATRQRGAATFANAIVLSSWRAAQRLFDALELSSSALLSDEIGPDGRLRRVELGGFELAARIGHIDALPRLTPSAMGRWYAMACALRNGHAECAARVCELASLDPNEDPAKWSKGIGILMRLSDPDYPNTAELRVAISRATLVIEAWANRSASTPGSTASMSTGATPA
ncbi:hypothetical protein Bcep1808_2106 [Burkholderia vietnamiensis G4]|uniref:Uncharacterized protein n=1 Tax=Burkholderia vietnamiensis (strain G4 / LMG 22486) TaxID=269482 RepID=A4JFQ5_BURVG|nr:hypothetical protein Bcep1808_2106 [Burkholderia vietnamiensis G4]